MTHADMWGRPINGGFHKYRRQDIISGVPGAGLSAAPTAGDTGAAASSGSPTLDSSSSSSSSESVPSVAPTTAPVTSASESSFSSSSSSLSSSSSDTLSSVSSESFSSSSSLSSIIPSTAASLSSTPSTTGAAQPTRSNGQNTADTAGVQFSSSILIVGGSAARGSSASASSPSTSSDSSKNDDDSGLSTGATTAIGVIGGLAAFALIFWLGVQILQSKRRKRREGEIDQIDFEPNTDPLHAALGIHRDNGSVSGHGHSGGGSLYAHSAAGSYGGGGRMQTGNRDLAEVQYEDDDTRREREAIYNDYMASIAPPPPAAGGLVRQPTTSAGMFGPGQEGVMLQRQPTNVGMMYGGLQRQPTMGMGQPMNGGGGGYGQAYDGFEGAYGGTGGHAPGQRSLDSMNGGGGYPQHGDPNAYPDPNARTFSPAPPAHGAYSPPQGQQRDLYAPQQHYQEEYDPFANGQQAHPEYGLARSSSVGTAKPAGET